MADADADCLRGLCVVGSGSNLSSFRSSSTQNAGLRLEGSREVRAVSHQVQVRAVYSVQHTDRLLQAVNLYRQVLGGCGVTVRDEVAFALAPFFDQIGPSHSDLTTLFRRAGLVEFDPAREPGPPVGKMRRVREVLLEAGRLSPRAGEQLTEALIHAVRATGGFRLGNPNYPGPAEVCALQAALRNLGYQLDDDGVLSPISLEVLDGRELTAALRAYVRRARLGGWDPAVVLGTGKSLEEATARHVLKERTGQYPVHSDLPTTLYQAFALLGLSVPKRDVVDAIPPDPRQALHQAVWLLGIAVNRFRNAEGEGHGRPEVPPTTTAEASIVGLAAAIVTELMLATDDRVH